MAKAKAGPNARARGVGKTGAKAAGRGRLVVRAANALVPRRATGSSPKPRPAVSKVLSRLYTITYQQSINGQLVVVTLQADTPFSMPIQGQPLEVRHDGVLISGLVQRIECLSSTFRNGSGYGTMDLHIIHVV